MIVGAIFIEFWSGHDLTSSVMRMGGMFMLQQIGGWMWKMCLRKDSFPRKSASRIGFMEKSMSPWLAEGRNMGEATVPDAHGYRVGY